LQKTYYKTASLISNSCKAVAILAGHTADVSMLAYEYGRNLVCETSYSFLPIFEARFLS
jgi:geranylgeranyl pyrophosphate synthase